MTADVDGITAIDRLKDHYKHCIRLSATNKINPKNAFDLQLIDYMKDLVECTEDGQMNFKIASSALDVGAKIYSNRVDYIQSEAQKVASSLMMALDGSEAKETSLEVSCEVDDEAKQPEKSRKRHKNIVTVVEDHNMLDAKLEKKISGDPFLDTLTQECDMSCPAALMSYNALTQPNCLLTIESSHLRINYKENSSPSSISTTQYDLVHMNCTHIIRNNQKNRICPRLDDFLFNDRTTTILGLNSNIDYRDEQPLPTGGDSHEFNPEMYDNADHGDDFVDTDSNVGEANEEIDPLPNLDKIAASKPTEYGYSTEHHRLIDTWAGPHAWKVIKAPQTARKEPKSARKRAKLEKKPIEFKEEFSKSLEQIADKDIRHSADVIRRWKKPLIPQDHNLNEETVRKALIVTFMKPEETYNCIIEEKVEKMDIDEAAPKSPGEASISPGLGDCFDDSDDEFRADPINGSMNDNLLHNATLEFAGEHLIEQPYTVAQVNIPFAKIAKKMDVRKLKRVMWDLLFPPEKRVEEEEQSRQDVTVIMNGVEGGDVINAEQQKTTKKTPSPSPSESAVHEKFLNLYGELPVRVSSKMASDLSQPIAFVTLLHLANEKNLKLIPNQDLRDFIIEQDELIY